jgi:hypothetical protein
VTSEVAPAASGRLSVANPLSGRGHRLIHHPFSVDCRASLGMGLVERYLLVAGDPAEHERSGRRRVEDRRRLSCASCAFAPDAESCR